MSNFNPEDIKAVQSGTATRRQIMVVLTSTTCGEPCWHATEDVCRCSCGGANHGCLRGAGGTQPVRTAKIDGQLYRLAAVGEGAYDLATQVNGQQYRSVEEPMMVVDDLDGGQRSKRNYTQPDIDAAKAAGGAVWFMQYTYPWRETDHGAPARVKWATVSQVEKWPELAAYRGQQDRPALCWVSQNMPTAPTQAVVDRTTGLPSKSQCPNDKLRHSPSEGEL